MFALRSRVGEQPGQLWLTLEDPPEPEQFVLDVLDGPVLLGDGQHGQPGQHLDRVDQVVRLGPPGRDHATENPQRGVGQPVTQQPVEQAHPRRGRSRRVGEGASQRGLLHEQPDGVTQLLAEAHQRLGVLTGDEFVELFAGHDQGAAAGRLHHRSVPPGGVLADISSSSPMNRSMVRVRRASSSNASPTTRSASVTTNRPISARSSLTTC